MKIVAIRERKNTIIVGAGASKEFGLPTGAELTGKIARLADIRFGDGLRLISGDYNIVETLRHLANHNNGSRNINPYLHEGWRIRDNMALAPSIDNFLHTHRQNDTLVELGKLLIARAIMSAEKESKLWVDYATRAPRLDMGSLADTWLARLFSLMVSAGDFNAFLEGISNITFVSFNYDRCIEQFLVLAAIEYFNLNLDEEAELRQALRIYFPYGSIGNLVMRRGQNNGFGIEKRGSDLIEISRGLRTFTEGCESKVADEISEALSESDVLIFLGFSFLPLNLSLLLRGGNYKIPKIIGTSKGMSKDSSERVRQELILGFGGEDSSSTELVDLTCGDFFHHFNRFFQQM